MQQTSERKQNKIQNNKGGFSMFKKMKHMKNEKGLTLIELLAVIVILAIVAAISIPAIGNIINTSRDKGQVSDALNIISGAKLAHIETGCGETTTGCTSTELNKHVDGKDVSSLVAKINSSNDWELKGYVFKFKSSEYKGKAGTVSTTGISPADDTVSETTLKTLIGTNN